VGKSLKGRQSEETAGTFDGVKRAEDLREQSAVLGLLFKFNQLLIQARKVLMTLDEKFTNHFLILFRHT
jgi:hypothetical protein